MLSLHHTGHDLVQSTVAAAADHQIVIVRQIPNLLYSVLRRAGRVNGNRVTGVGHGLNDTVQLSSDIFFSCMGIIDKKQFLL